MVDRLAIWVKQLEARNNVLGSIFHLCYKICAHAGFQSAVHLIASCILGAFCYKDNVLNWKFLIPFGVLYILAIAAFGIANQYQASGTNSIRKYRLTYDKLTQSLQEEFRKDLNLYNTLSRLSLAEMNSFYSEHDIYCEACFRVCAAVEDLLKEISGKDSFRVMTFLRTTKNGDQYSVNAYSPQYPTPESYGHPFDLTEYSNKRKKAKSPVHARPFLNSRFEPIIYIGDAVQQEYANFNDTHPTKLHISIPCIVNRKVFAVLQITSYENCLGNRKNITELINNMLIIYTSYLKVVYMHQILHEQIADKLPTIN